MLWFKVALERVVWAACSGYAWGFVAIVETLGLEGVHKRMCRLFVLLCATHGRLLIAQVLEGAVTTFVPIAVPLALIAIQNLHCELSAVADMSYNQAVNCNARRSSICGPQLDSYPSSFKLEGTHLVRTTAAFNETLQKRMVVMERLRRTCCEDALVGNAQQKRKIHA